MGRYATIVGISLLTVMSAACSENAQEEASEASAAIGNDVEQTGASIADSASNAWNAGGNAASNVGDAIEEGVEDVAPD